MSLSRKQRFALTGCTVGVAVPVLWVVIKEFFAETPCLMQLTTDGQFSHWRCWYWYEKALFSALELILFAGIATLLFACLERIWRR